MDGLIDNLNDVIYGNPRFQSVIAKTAIRQGFWARVIGMFAVAAARIILTDINQGSWWHPAREYKGFDQTVWRAIRTGSASMYYFVDFL